MIFPHPQRAICCNIFGCVTSFGIIASHSGKLDELTVSMENQIAENPDAVASEIMKADPHLKPTFEGYLDLFGSAELIGEVGIPGRSWKGSQKYHIIIDIIILTYMDYMVFFHDPSICRRGWASSLPFLHVKA